MSQAPIQVFYMYYLIWSWQQIYEGCYRYPSFIYKETEAQRIK